VSLDATVGIRFERLAIGVDLSVASGEVVALVGPSGAGKTSVLRAIAGLLPLTAGRVVVDGTVFEDTATGEYVPPERRNLGVVFQDALLFPHMTVLDNVASGLRFTGTSWVIARARAREWLTRIGIDELAFPGARRNASR
jgi:molybdate transport system ATP-binding protein